MTLKHFMRFDRRLFSAEGGTGGGLAAAAAAQSGEGGSQGGENGGGNGGGWKAPDGLPQEFSGASADEALGKLFAGYNDLNTRFSGMREKLAKMPAAPEKPDLYAYEPPDALKPFFGDLAKDPLFGAAKAAAHKYGLSNEQLSGFITDALGPMAEQGLLAQPYSPQAELKNFQDALGLDKGATAQTLAANETFANGLASQLKVPDAMKNDVKAALLSLTDTAVGNVLLQALSGRMNDVGIRIGGEGGEQGAMTADDLKKLDSDPRIDPRNRDSTDPNIKFDPDLRRRYDEAYNRLFPPSR